MKATSIKLFIAAALAGIGAYFRLLLVPVTVLVLVMVGDYVTGMAEAFISRTVSSRIGIIGIIKKVCYLATVAVGITVDWIFSSALSSAGIIEGGDFYVFGIVVTVWLIINELISILENLASIGVPLPGFLTSALAKLSRTIETRISYDDDSKNSDISQKSDYNAK